MKIRKLVSVVAMAAVTLAFVSCNEDAVTGVDDTFEFASTEKSSEVGTLAGPYCTFDGILTEADIAGLMEMREEEKLARDVYLALYDTHNHPVFNNISKSENAHMSAVLYLINGYELEDPAPDAAGEFSSPLFSDLYAQLTGQGSASLIDALKTGAFIEEYDIADLMKLLEETENADIKRVYGNLLRGSKFHLKAFTGVLANLGVTYTPTILSEELYLEIVGETETDTNTGTGTNSTPGVCDGTGPNA